MGFFQGFNLDTLLALISCIAGIVALFLSGRAIKYSKTINNSFNDEKEFGNNGIDNSKKAGGDIIEYNYDANALATLTSANFKASLEKAYEFFEKKTEDNLHKIFEETRQIIIDNKINLGSYTKIDWINVYFENAKTSSNEYMQKVWAKVLAKELSFPNSFSYKSLDILKNMNEEDFKLFEHLCSLSIDNSFLSHKVNDLYKKFNLSWVSMLRLKEFNLVSLDGTQKTYTLEPGTAKKILYGEKYLIVLKNNTNEKIDYKMSIYVLTQFALEIECITKKSVFEDFVIEYVKELKKEKNNGLNISLYRVKSIENGIIDCEQNDLSEDK